MRSLFFLVLIFFIGCSKNSEPSSNNPPTKPLSSEKSITGFVFSKADNAALVSDATGVIGHDTIQVSVPAGTDVTVLKATLTITGKTVNPQNKAAVDFSGTVVYTVKAEDGSTKNYAVLVSIDYPANSVVFIGSDDGYLYVLDAGTGAIRYRLFDRDSRMTSTVENDIVYTGTQAFNWKTGVTSLQFIDPDGSYGASPLVRGNTIYTCGIKYLYALDKASAVTIKWKTDLTDPPHGGVMGASSPCMDNNTLFIGSGVYLYALDAATGEKKWATELSEGLVESGPAVANGTVYVGNSHSGLYAVDAQTGNVKWNAIAHSGIYASPTVHNGVVYVGNFLGEFYAISAADGAVKWQTKLPNQVFSSAMVVDGVVYVGSSGSQLHALAESTGNILWSSNTLDGPIPGGFSSPVVANGVVYIGSTDHSIYAFNAKDGHRKWRTRLSDLVRSSPCVVDTLGHVFNSTVSGMVN